MAQAESTTTTVSQAPAGTPPGGQQQPGFGFETLFPFLALGIVFWLLIIRPQSKERKKKEQMISAMKIKDKVVTIGGLFGTVSAIDGDEIVLLVDSDKNIKMRFRREAISAILTDEEKK